MKIPTEPVERKVFYADILRQCTGSRNDRWEFNTLLRNYYLFGSKDSSGAAYNKIASTVDTLWSFMYSSDTAKFSIHLGTSANEGDLAKVEPIVDEINDQWRASKSNLTFAMGGKWSLVYGAIIFKTIWHNSLAKTYVVEPSQFGVLREDVMDLDDQEAFVHCYQITLSQLDSMLVDNPRRKDIMSRVGNNKKANGDEGNMGDGLGRLILSSGVSTGIGAATGGGSIEGGIGAVNGGMYDYRPQVEAELVDMYELYIWNDEIDDYQIITIASPDVVIFDRKNFNPSRSHPFTVLRPEHDCYDYFWGVSFAARLTYLQDWRDERTMQIKALLEKQADPPMSFTGASGIAEEKMQAMRRAGGQISASMPNMQVNVHAPQLPSGMFTEIQEIDAMFADASGITSILQGQGAAGVRSKGQADLMARLGSSRVKQKALIVEESAARLATLMMRYVQNNSTQRFMSKEKGPDGHPLTFIANQFTTDFEIRVDAHSSSPVFVEDLKSEAIELLKAKAIDRATLLRMFDPPNVQQLLEKLKVIEAQEAEQAKVQLQLAQEKVQGKGPK